MVDALGLFGLLFLLLGGSKGSKPAPAGRTAPRLPPGSTPAPWPQVVPTDLPRFPGPGWVYDEPPPKAVQQRAGQLLSQLWKTGKGSSKTEQTAGRWITYSAEIVRSGKQGVVAYRLKDGATTASPAPAVSRAPAPPPAAPRVLTSPGLPQMAPAVTVPVSYQPPAPAPGSTRLEVPGGTIDVRPAPSPLSLPVLTYGRGLKPAAPDKDVVLLQQKLGIEADGRFGTGTRSAVIAFQKKVGLAPDLPEADLIKRGFGAVKQATWTALFAVRA